MLVTALGFSLLIAALMLAAGIASINEEPTRVKALNVAIATFTVLVMIAPAVVAVYLEPDNWVIRVSASWLVGWAIYLVAKMITQIDSRAKLITPRRGLVSAAVNLTFIFALATVLAQVA